MSHYDEPVQRWMRSPVRTIREDSSLSDADHILREHTLSSLAVIDDAGRPLGVISRTDLLRVGRAKSAFGRRAPLLELPAQPVSSVMTRGMLSVAPDASLADAATIMVSQHVHRVFVVQGAQLAGVLSTRDLMDAVAAHKEKAPISDFMSTPVISVSSIETVGRATDRLEDAKVAGVLVTDEREWPVGLFTQVEALQARELPASTPVEDVMNYALLCMDLETQLHRAARHAIETRARRIVAVHDRRVCGVLTGIDFARIASRR
ncbi:MAG: CBS domain-containing protein [Myxococcales bacterium]|nr:CBS domain-containing protein [Myxococcales bacterium]